MQPAYQPSGAPRPEQAQREDSVSNNITRLYERLSEFTDVRERIAKLVVALDGMPPNVQVPSQGHDNKAHLQNPRPPHLVGSLGHINAESMALLAHIDALLTRVEGALL